MSATSSLSAIPRVSFVVPLYNCLSLTQAMLASLRTTLPSGLVWELILVDDGSTDETPAWLATLSETNIRSLRNTSNEGFATAVNRGAAIARGELIVLLNNDLVLTKRWLEPMLGVYRRLGSRAGAIGNRQTEVSTGLLDHSGIRIDLKGKPEHMRDGWSGSLFASIRGYRRVIAATGACLLISRKLWMELNGFDTRFVNGCEDVDFCLRALAARKTNAVALGSTVAHHVSSSPGRKLRDEENTYRLTLKWRDTLAILAARRWCWDFLSREWTHPREPAGALDAARALAFGLHLRPQPPAVALAGMSAAIEHEFSRWRELGLAG
ncbi:MAG: glycosyltransferase family 2 protein [Opitutaceae bacterium]|nr:glycosyltransferase family 2 protein [Opitutaceae bacterium]